MCVCRQNFPSRGEGFLTLHNFFFRLFCSPFPPFYLRHHFSMYYFAFIVLTILLRLIICLYSHSQKVQRQTKFSGRMLCGFSLARLALITFTGVCINIFIFLSRGAHKRARRVRTEHQCCFLTPAPHLRSMFRWLRTWLHLPHSLCDRHFLPSSFLDCRYSFAHRYLSNAIYCLQWCHALQARSAHSCSTTGSNISCRQYQCASAATAAVHSRTRSALDDGCRFSCCHDVARISRCHGCRSSSVFPSIWRSTHDDGSSFSISSVALGDDDNYSFTVLKCSHCQPFCFHCSVYSWSQTIP